MRKKKGGRPLPKWSAKILELKFNNQYTLYELSEIFEINFFSIKMFFRRHGIKEDGYFKKYTTRNSFYNGNKLIEKYLEILNSKNKKYKFCQKRFIKLAKLFAERSSNKRKDLFVDILS